MIAVRVYDTCFKVREGRPRPDLLRSHLKAHISLNIYDTLIYDIPKNRRLSHLSTDIRHINRPILILGKQDIRNNIFEISTTFFEHRFLI